VLVLTVDKSESNKLSYLDRGVGDIFPDGISKKEIFALAVFGRINNSLFDCIDGCLNL
jgi:hypothetical protein